MTEGGNSGGLWRPANSTDGEDFEHQWCRHCLDRNGEGEWEDEFGDDIEGRCALLDAAFWGGQPPQWKLRDGAPYCTAFREDPANPARCPFTMEMFR